MTVPARIDSGMSKAEIALLLSVIAAYDQRTIGDADVEAWHATAQHGKWNFLGARRAVVDHYTQNTKRIMPADITKFLREPGESGQRICEY